MAPSFEGDFAAVREIGSVDRTVFGTAVTAIGILVAAAATAFSAGVAAAGVMPASSETVFNIYTSGAQTVESPRAVATGGGKYLVVWGSADQDGDGSAVIGRLYDDAGAPLAAEFVVNSFTTGDQARASAAYLSTGEFLVVWDSSLQDGSGTAVVGQRLDATGAKVGTEFAINDYTTGDQQEPVVAADAGGGFVVSWADAGGLDGDGSGVFARRFSDDGTAAGASFQVNAYTTSDQREASLSIASTGEIVIAWSSDGQDGDAKGIVVNRFDSAGVPLGTEFVVNTGTAGSQDRPAAAVFGAADEFVVAWSGQDGDGKGVVQRLFDASGAPLGAEFVANTYTTGDQDSASVAAAGSNLFVVAWSGFGDDPDGTGVSIRTFDSAGVAASEEVLANEFTTGDQGPVPAVASDGAGGFLVVWDSPRDGSASAVAGRTMCQDTDGDSICDAADACPGSDDSADADADSIPDGCDLCPLDPVNDIDGDGVCADVDNCPVDANASQADADNDDRGDACDLCPGFDDSLDADADSIPDGCDACPLDPDDDIDGDGVCGDADNCPLDANASQADADGDDSGDACDLCPGFDDRDDADGDETPDACDSCPLDPNNDIDGDSLCANVDPCPLDGDNDADGDALCGDVDNCPGIPNVSQLDFDGDDIGDPCDTADVPGMELSRLWMQNTQYPDVGRWNAAARIGAVVVFSMLDDILEGGIVVRLESTVDPAVNEVVFPPSDCALVNTTLRCTEPTTGSRVQFKHKNALDPFSISVRVRGQTFRNPSFNEMPLAFAFRTPSDLLDRRAEIPAEACVPKSRGPSCRVR